MSLLRSEKQRKADVKKATEKSPEKTSKKTPKENKKLNKEKKKRADAELAKYEADPKFQVGSCLPCLRTISADKSGNTQSSFYSILLGAFDC